LAFLLEKYEGTHWPTHPVRFFSPLSLEKNAPACSAFSQLIAEAEFLSPQKYGRRKYVDRTNDMAGGPTRTLPQSGGERRPSRHGVRKLVS